jgi:hypothetical protein
MNGSKARIFELAAAIENWPDILPHYREVIVFDQSLDGNRKVVEMAAYRYDFPITGVRFPVRWQSVQVCDPDESKIYFKHTRGIALGMWVVWELVDNPDQSVSVTIRHDLVYPLSIMNGWFARELVGHQFVEYIAGRTLATIKSIVESEAHS